jgi:hypothetical protein
MERAPRLPNMFLADPYADFVARIHKTPPTETTFAVGQVVAYVNYYGSVFPGHVIIGFTSSDDDCFRKSGRFIYLDGDCYWLPQSPESLRPIDSEGRFEVKEGEVVYQYPIRWEE